MPIPLHSARATLDRPMLSDPLSRALDEAVAGRRGPLFELLTRGSRLPGPRANGPLAEAFAQSCRIAGRARRRAGARDGAPVSRRGARGHAARVPADVWCPGPGRSGDGRRSGPRDVPRRASRARRRPALSRTRSGGRWARAHRGRRGRRPRRGNGFLDGRLLHAAAVLRALARESWLSQVHEPDGAIRRLDEAFELARDAPRAAARYPGHKALLQALEEGPPRVALRFGVPVFDLMSRWATVKDPVLRDLVETVLADGRLAGRFRSELDRVRRELAATAPPVRNPDHDHGPSRDRSGARRRGRK